MAETDAQLDEKLRQLLTVMMSRVPADKRVSVSVVQQLLRSSKYAATYPDAYVTSREQFIADVLAQLTRERDATAAAAAAAAGTTRSAAAKSTSNKTTTTTSTSASSTSSEDEEEDDDDEEDEEDEEEDDEQDDEADDEEDEEDEEEDEEEADDDKDAPAGKRARVDDDGSNSNDQGNDDEAAAALRARSTAMVTCLKKLGYRPRPRAHDETAAEYVATYLTSEFVKHELDPQRYGAADVRRYKALREIALLQQDGAQLQLDRRARAGRGYAHVELPTNNKHGGEQQQQQQQQPSTSSSAYKTAAFLDDVDEA